MCVCVCMYLSRVKHLNVLPDSSRSPAFWILPKLYGHWKSSHRHPVQTFA